MSDYSVIIQERDYLLQMVGELALVLSDEGITLNVSQDDSSVNITEESFQILSNAAPGIPVGGVEGYVLAKRNNADFETQWVPQTKITVGLTAPTSPQIGDLWVDTN